MEYGSTLTRSRHRLCSTRSRTPPPVATARAAVPALLDARGDGKGAAADHVLHVVACAAAASPLKTHARAATAAGTTAAAEPTAELNAHNGLALGLSTKGRPSPSAARACDDGDGGASSPPVPLLLAIPASRGGFRGRGGGGEPAVAPLA